MNFRSAAWLGAFALLALFQTPPAHSADGCGPFDPDCSKRILRILTGIHIAPVEVEGGARFGNGDTDGAVKFKTTVAGMDVGIGDLSVMTFEAVYLPDQGGVRLRINLGHSDVLFFCRDENGSLHAPGAGFFNVCRPDASMGVGATLGDIQWDTATGKVAGRWAEINAVYNFLSNGNSFDYLHKRLLAFLGTSVETIWPGNTAPEGTGVESLARLNMGVMGMIRSQDNHWEIRGYAGYRPNATQFDDYAVELRSKLLYHLLVNPTTMADIGLDLQFSHWSEPWKSIGTYASDRDQSSAYVGLLFGLTFQ